MKLPKLSPPVKRPHFIEPALAVDVEHGRTEDLVNIRMDLLHGANYNDPAAFSPGHQHAMYFPYNASRYSR
ncbi:hypothetical protein Lepto7376_0895 [[Leptolyngbya] sp. PCC 7376]|uniref:cyanobactin biosynthesis system PatB/AcyB/McaB family protein n=1 Tax=[Leptolyngbya] sp. PCC 7376 TaxID=111781 RepID=UPI00029F0DFD|nr:cyanobactin biosynthesis system PatB/AcyB/McaB family protein [[Leptolyngbya] sp. PCC 7376]AFY37275.1 hypothetical protein Lepto7376_0895 [[Leptolyngbya] sp. PCC 7376]